MMAGEIRVLGRIVAERHANDLEWVSRRDGPEMACAASYPRSFDAAGLVEKMEAPLGTTLELVTWAGLSDCEAGWSRPERLLAAYQHWG